MHYGGFLTLFAACTRVQADFVVDYYADNDSCNSDADPGKSSVFTNNCFQVNNDYASLTLSTDDGTTLEQCGPFFEDSECSRELTGSDTFTCSSCQAYLDNLYVYVA